MTLRQKVILVDAQEMELWELQHPGHSFSKWVRQQIHQTVRPDEPEQDPPASYTLEEVEAIVEEQVEAIQKCRKNIPCHQCPEPDCEERVAEYKGGG